MNRQDTKKNRGIEWTQPPYVERGYTANPIRGCKMGCEWFLEQDKDKHAICYAKTMAERIGKNKTEGAYSKGFEFIEFVPEELQAIENLDIPSCFFIDSMSDLFGAGVRSQWVSRVIDTMNKCPHHIFQCLTKQPYTMAKWAASMPDNAWLGVSAPPQVMRGKMLSAYQQELWWGNALNQLAQLENPVKFVSIEPLSWGRDEHGTKMSDILAQNADGLQWAIIGAASYGARTIQPNRDVFIDIMQILKSSSVPVFFKGNIDSVLANDVCGEWLEQYPSPETFNYVIKE